MRWKFFLTAFCLILASAAGLVWLRVNNHQQIPGGTITSPLEITTIPPQFEDKSVFLSPIKQNTTTSSSEKVTGITVPHHLLATDLIASAFKFAASTTPNQILLISPDRFD